MGFPFLLDTELDARKIGDAGICRTGPVVFTPIADRDSTDPPTADQGVHSERAHSDGTAEVTELGGRNLIRMLLFGCAGAPADTSNRPDLGGPPWHRHWRWADPDALIQTH
jgi:hypothetical protein